jgi:hypothetical protein
MGAPYIYDISSLRVKVLSFLCVVGETKDFTVAHANQQRICHTCTSDWEKNASQEHEILKIVFGDNVMGRTQNLAWFSRLACLGGVVFIVFELSGRQYTGRIKSYVEYVCTVINKDRRSTDSKTARRLGISYGISQGVFE